MLKINKKVEYALIALKYMAQDKINEVVATRELCQVFSIPFDPMAKVMQVLNHSEIVTSVQGIRGGYKLVKSLKEINFYELNKLIVGETFGCSCNGPKSVCDQFTNCNIVGPLNTLNLKLIHFFEGISLYELLMETKGPCFEDTKEMMSLESEDLVLFDQTQMKSLEKGRDENK